MKWRCVQRLAHQCANVVVTGYAVYRRADRSKNFAETIVRAAAVVMNQVTGNDDEVGAPVAIMIVIEHRTQRRMRHGAAQISRGVGKQMRIGKVQNPQ